MMFLFPFIMATMLRAEECGSVAFSPMYHHPCSLQCTSTNDGSLTSLSIFLALWPAVIAWGCGTAIGELPPYFVTRAAKRAGARATDFEHEIEASKDGTDLLSRMKIWTINFTEAHGFLGIFLLASWPNAAFDMCGMACGWLQMPFLTFFGATLLGKGFVKVSLQLLGMRAVFGPALWAGMLAVAGRVPHVGAKVAEQMVRGRAKVMYLFSLQERVTVEQLLGGGASLDGAALTAKLCAVPAVAPLCGERSSLLGGYADAAKLAEVKLAVGRILGAHDADADGRLSESELVPLVGATDGKLSLASLDPGKGGALSLGNLWGAFIGVLILFFVVSMVEQIALQAQAADDDAELDALEAELGAKAKGTPKKVK
jgi:membrane protein YqaA with SNARE-associated domain